MLLSLEIVSPYLLFFNTVTIPVSRSLPIRLILTLKLRYLIRAILNLPSAETVWATIHTGGINQLTITCHRAEGVKIQR